MEPCHTAGTAVNATHSAASDALGLEPDVRRTRLRAGAESLQRMR